MMLMSWKAILSPNMKLPAVAKTSISAAKRNLTVSTIPSTRTSFISASINTTATSPTLLVGPSRARFVVFGSVAALVALNSATTGTKSSCLHDNKLATSGETSVFVPTLEAAARAARLIKTVTLIVIDYESFKAAEVGRRQWWWSYIVREQENKEMILAKEQVEKCTSDFEDAQALYTKDDHERLTLKEEKLRQQEAMHEAAERLVEAEEALESLGGSDRKGAVHRKAAGRILKLCRENAGVYIKLGQHLANLDYLIPAEYTQVLSSLFNDAPQTDFDHVCQVVREDLGGSPDEIFDDFSRTPIASASLAQVHVAYTKGPNRRKLAVKIQHRGLRETSKGDIYILLRVVRTVESLFKEFTWGWIADELAPQLPKELDFTLEGKNAEKAEQNLKSTGLACVIPKVIWNETTTRVLTMEFEEGFKATDVDAIEATGLKKRDVAKLIASVFNSQVFISAFVHCDPHPANVLLRANARGKPEIVLVDHGLYKGLEDDFRIQYARLWRALMTADIPEIKSTCKDLGIEEAYPLFAGMLTARPFDEIIERSRTGSLVGKPKAGSKKDRAVIRGYAQRYLTQILDLLGSMPRDMLLLLKMNDCLRHIDYALGSPTNTVVVAGLYAAKAIYQKKKDSSSFKDRFLAWLDYTILAFRIKVQFAALWFVQALEN